jgi:fermentation-respiration switch protein FrsA (DUF1100 family)
MVATDGAPAEDVEAARKAAERALDQLAAGASRKELRAAIRAMVDAQRKLGAPIGPELVDATVEAAVEQMRSPWYRYFVGYDPAPDLQKIRVPVLALGGSLDRQVPAEASLTAIEAALVKGGNKDVTTAVLPGLNHLLQTAVAGTVQEYAQIEETFDPAALKRISEWVVKRAGR